MIDEEHKRLLETYEGADGPILRKQLEEPILRKQLERYLQAGPSFSAERIIALICRNGEWCDLAEEVIHERLEGPLAEDERIQLLLLCGWLVNQDRNSRVRELSLPEILHFLPRRGQHFRYLIGNIDCYWTTNFSAVDCEHLEPGDNPAFAWLCFNNPHGDSDVDAVDDPKAELTQFAEILNRLEAEPLANPKDIFHQRFGLPPLAQLANKEQAWPDDKVNALCEEHNRRYTEQFPHLQRMETSFVRWLIAQTARHQRIDRHLVYFGLALRCNEPVLNALCVALQSQL